MFLLMKTKIYLALKILKRNEYKQHKIQIKEDVLENIFSAIVTVKARESKSDVPGEIICIPLHILSFCQNT